MTKRIEITEIHIEDLNVLIRVNNKDIELLEGTEPSGRILSDSDGLAFIYILESKDEFIYISIKHDCWHYLKEGLKRSLPFILEYGDKQMKLDSFNEELKQLIQNVEGNANYGKEMVSEVEKVFLTL
jgi:hypothetical protein